MKFCIISDIHCKGQAKIDSHSFTNVFSNQKRVPANQNPVAALLELIKNENGKLNADVVICPGDLGDRADDIGISAGWRYLEEIQQTIGAKLLLALPGNHDINSRVEKGDAFDFIKNFHEKFPVAGEAEKHKFWNEGYCIVYHEGCQIVLINTVHHHKDHENAKTAKLHDNVISGLKKDLAANKNPLDYRICVLHHHPVKHSNINKWNDTDSVEEGDNLLKLLREFSFQIVIHGHKHQPRLIEVDGLPIIACGSFGSFDNLQNTGIQQMFHIVELESNKFEGFVKSWEYNKVDGWKQIANPIFPPVLGFGTTMTADQAANKIKEMFAANGGTPMFYSTMVEKCPELQYLVYTKREELARKLKEQNIGTNPEFPLTPISVHSY